MDSTYSKRGLYIPWKVFFLLIGLGLIGSAGVLPYVRSLLQAIPGGDEAVRTMSPPVFFVLTLAQGFFLSVLLSFVGLLIAAFTGFGTPVLARVLQPEIKGVPAEELYVNRYLDRHSGLKAHFRVWIPEFLVPVLLGIGAGIALVALDFFVFAPALTESVADPAARPEWWRGLLASFYGGIVEEILLRLFFLNLIVLVLMKITRRERGRPSERQIWTAIILSTLIFAAGHLPTVAASGSLSGLMILRIMVLNSIAGIVFGLVFTRRGLLPAMASHFSADIVLHVIVAALL